MEKPADGGDRLFRLDITKASCNHRLELLCRVKAKAANQCCFRCVDVAHPPSDTWATSTPYCPGPCTPENLIATEAPVPLIRILVNPDRATFSALPRQQP